MGATSSKFRKHLQTGDEYMALQLYRAHSDLRKSLDPNLSYSIHLNLDTPLHMASRNAMKALIRLFLNDHNGNPNKRNSNEETSLHCVCQTENGQNFAVQKRRLDSLMLLLDWKTGSEEEGNLEKIKLDCQDNKLNTPLHYAAMSGLSQCVQLLISFGAPLYLENSEHLTACDCAEKAGYSDIALSLESKMVFAKDSDATDEESIIIDFDENFSGLRAQDLQEAKDHLLVQTADMLHISLFTAEALLRNHGWCRERLLEAWFEDAAVCCEKCGVNPPEHVLPGAEVIPMLNENAPQFITDESPSDESVCDICLIPLPADEPNPVLVDCGHLFCFDCWNRYLSMKITAGETHDITCPGYCCAKLVSNDVIESVVSRDMARRYLQFDIKAFVETNPMIKWCPFPSCGRAVKLPLATDGYSPSHSNNPAKIAEENDTSHAVDCGEGHFFCWECLGEAHAPSSCTNFKKWHERIQAVNPEDLKDTAKRSEHAANCLWLVTNSKLCPNCQSPIQKNEGCNHMKCMKCKNDFCWVCLEAWKKHNFSTGGYFRCNRYDAVQKVEKKNLTKLSEASKNHENLQELNRFVHYFTRYKNHENSYRLEEPLLNSAKEKMLTLAKAITNCDVAAEVETKFVEDAIKQLLQARRILKCSYIYGFYLEDGGYKRQVFDLMQTELEECTESLSQMVCRPYLRTPRNKIVNMAQLVQKRRHAFMQAVLKGLIPPDTSPPNSRRDLSLEIDEDLKKALRASVAECDLNNPWVMAPNGLHTNLATVLDLSDDEDESDKDGEQILSGIRQTSIDYSNDKNRNDEPFYPTGATAVKDYSPTVPCRRENCNRPRLRNKKIGGSYDFCSLRCVQAHRRELLAQLESDENHALEASSQDSIPNPEASDDVTDPLPSVDHVDFLRAIELSKLHLQRELELMNACGSRLTPSHNSQTRSSNNDPPSQNASDHDELTTNDPSLSAIYDAAESAPLEDETKDFNYRLQQAIILSMSDIGNPENADLEKAIRLSQLQTDIEDPMAGTADVLVHGPEASNESLDTALMGAGCLASSFTGDDNPKSFGLIKNLSVENIFIEEKDKTNYKETPSELFLSKPKLTSSVTKGNELTGKTSKRYSQNDDDLEDLLVVQVEPRPLEAHFFGQGKRTTSSIPDIDDSSLTCSPEKSIYSTTVIIHPGPSSSAATDNHHSTPSENINADIIPKNQNANEVSADDIFLSVDENEHNLNDDLDVAAINLSGEDLSTQTVSDSVWLKQPQSDV